ncbi:MAG: MBL fold metallo-hydrolase [Limnochordia bacterium]|jgi:L-ascorbate metabolism protein UlaG (beta-lactamase superfamily)
MIKIGPVRITPVGHGSLIIRYAGRVIHVDPYSEAGDYSRLPKADQIWITHEHYDHFDPSALELIRQPTTEFIVPPSVAGKIEAPAQINVLKNGDRCTVMGVTVEAVPAYNVVRERSPGVKYHPQGTGNGYVADFEGHRIYVAGDTECIPEMSRLQDIELAILPLMLPYTMSPQEAVQAVQSFLPRQVLPYHTTPKTAQEFARLLKASKTEVELVGV